MSYPSCASISDSLLVHPGVPHPPSALRSPPCPGHPQACECCVWELESRGTNILLGKLLLLPEPTPCHPLWLPFPTPPDGTKLPKGFVQGSNSPCNLPISFSVTSCDGLPAGVSPTQTNVRTICGALKAETKICLTPEGSDSVALGRI